MRLRAAGAATILLLAAPAAAWGDAACLDGHEAFVDAAVSQAISDLGDMGLDKAGEAALETLYQNALKNVPQWPVGTINSNFSSSADAPLLKDSPWAKVLKNLSRVRDGLIRPMEALDAGDDSAAWGALQSFAADVAGEEVLAAALGEGPGALVHGAVQVAQASHAALEQETCLLAVDLEFYNATMADAALSPAHKASRVDHYLADYLLGTGTAPSGYPREEHQRRLQCYIDTELSPEERTQVFGTTLGQRTPFDRIASVFTVLNAQGSDAPNRALRTAIGAMLHDFDARAQWEDAKAKLRTVRAEPDYDALRAVVDTITDTDAVASNFCAAYRDALAGLPQQTPKPQAAAQSDPANEGPSVRPESIRCDLAVCKAAGPAGSAERDECLQAASLRWLSPEPCRRAADPTACAGPALLRIGNPYLLKEFVTDRGKQDALLPVLMMQKRDVSVLALITDNETFDASVVLASYLAHDWMNGQLPPPNWCDQMRGNYQGDYPDDANMHRNQCEAIVAAQHSLSGEDRCKTVLPARLRPRATQDKLETEVAAMNLCYKFLDLAANARSLTPAQAQRQMMDLMVGDAAASGRTLTLPDLGDVDVDTSQDPVIAAAQPASGDEYAWCGRGDAPVVTLDQPMLDGAALDACITFGAQCWKPAADAWCRRQGHGDAVSFTGAAGGRSKSQGDGKICEASFCGHFTAINCAASPAMESNLPLPGTPLCPTLATGPQSPLDQSRVLVMTYFGGARVYYRHPKEGFLCGYGTGTSSDFTGEYLVEAGGGYVGYVLDKDGMALYATYTRTGEETDSKGDTWSTGTSESAAKVKGVDWKARWVSP